MRSTTMRAKFTMRFVTTNQSRFRDGGSFLSGSCGTMGGVLSFAERCGHGRLRWRGAALLLASATSEEVEHPGGQPDGETVRGSNPKTKTVVHTHLWMTGREHVKRALESADNAAVRVERSRIHAQRRRSWGRCACPSRTGSTCETRLSPCRQILARGAFLTCSARFPHATSLRIILSSVQSIISISAE